MIWSSPSSVFVRVTEFAFTQVTSGAVALHDDSHFGVAGVSWQARTRRTSIEPRTVPIEHGR
jgi:hypothetical protein